ncbi:MAG: OmpA family protein [Rhizobiaceae bacterium]|nr:OmpA family protein [Rhizobiaceae bacterium]
MKIIRPHYVVALAALFPMASSPTMAAYFSPGSLGTVTQGTRGHDTGHVLLVQAGEPESVLNARANLVASEEALRIAETDNGDVDAARKSVKKARRGLAQALADAGLPLAGQSAEKAEAEAAAPEKAPEASVQADVAAEQPVEATTEQTEEAQPQEDSAETAPAVADIPKPEEKPAAIADADGKQKKGKADTATAEEEKPNKRNAEDKLTKKQKREKARAEAESASDGEQVKKEQAEAKPAAPESTGIQGEEADPQVNKLRKKLAAEREKVRELESRQSDQTDQKGRKDRKNRGDESEVRGGDNRTIFKLGDRVIIRSDSETDRILRGANDIEVTNLPRGRSQTTVTRPNGSQIITIRDSNGDIIYRVRKQRNGRELVLIDNRPLYEERRPRGGVEINLPPIRLKIPQSDYVIEMGNRVNQNAIRSALTAPPVESVERAYSLEEVRYSERLRDKLRRIDTPVTFDSGSAAISPTEIPTLDRLALAMEAILDQDPDTIFLIEGHTDAIGSEISNLALSDRRAESIAIALSEYFNIPPENLITQGYGEAYLKVPTLEAERNNRRVAVRNITNLLREPGR